MVTRSLPRLNVILDADAARASGWTLPDLASACLAGGARFLQVRAKRAPSGWFLDTAATIVGLARAVRAIVIVNDRADIAVLAGADGVHLGQTDLSPELARRIVGPDAIVGLSTHTRAQVDAALDRPISYLAIGPVFETTTKATGYEAVGIDAVTDAARRCAGRQLPVVAIGGITLESAPAVIAAGARAVALIGDILNWGNPEARVRAVLARLDAE